MMTFKFHKEDWPAEKVLGLPAPPSVGTGDGWQGFFLPFLSKNGRCSLKMIDLNFFF